ncbi:hypothetical protein CCOS2040_07455 [Streptomyces albidoflavus]|nr:hypothetical protein CCOS2040_07455 [Streptomyces albidoflavus]
MNSATASRTGPPSYSGAVTRNRHRVGAEPCIGRAGKARATSSTVYSQGRRASSAAGAGGAPPGPRTSHSFHNAPPDATTASNRNAGQSTTGHRNASHSRSPTTRRSTASGTPSTDRNNPAPRRPLGDRTIACHRRFASRIAPASTPSSRRASSTIPA